MRLAIAILVASLLALGGIASAEDRSVSVTGTINQYLEFVVPETTTGIDLSPTTTPSDEWIVIDPSGDYIDTNGDWSITVNIPVYKLSTTSGTLHTLTNCMAVYYNADDYNGPGTFTVESGGPTGTDHSFDIKYGQDYDLTDYAGTYGTTVTWAATSTF